MRNLITSVITIMLSGCAQYQWYKPGASQQDFQQDGYACLREAAQTYPNQQVPMQIGGGDASLTNTFCNRNATTVNCMTMGGQPTVIYVDANEDNRAAAARQCMAIKGWRLMQVR